MIKLRQYQEDCVNTVLSEYLNGINRQLLSLPCGAGKTIIFCTILKKISDMLGYTPKILIIAHSIELQEQAKAKLKYVWPDVPSENINIMSQLKAANRIDILGEIDVCIVDEAHHTPAKMYVKVLEGLGFLSSLRKLLIGVTATPKRADGIGLDNIFQKLTYSISIGKLIHLGFLVPVEAYRYTKIDTKGLSISRGDFNTKQLEERVNTDKERLRVFSAIEKYCGSFSKKTIIFCASIKHAKDLYACFKTLTDYKGMALLHSNMSAEERQTVITKYQHGEITVIINCNILTEGFDVPDTECIIMASPTHSQTRYIQRIGRAMRPSPNKEIAIIVDCTDNEHKIITAHSIEGLIYKKCEICGIHTTEQKTKKCIQCNITFCSKCGNSQVSLCGNHCQRKKCSSCHTELINYYTCSICFQTYCGTHGSIIEKNPYIRLSKKKTNTWVCFNCIPANSSKRNICPRGTRVRSYGGHKGNEKLNLFTTLPWEMTAKGYIYSNTKLCLEVIRHNEHWYYVSINGKCSKRSYCKEYAMEQLEDYLMNKGWDQYLPKLEKQITPKQRLWLESRGYLPELYTFAEAQKLIIQSKYKKKKRY